LIRTSVPSQCREGSGSDAANSAEYRPYRWIAPKGVSVRCISGSKNMLCVLGSAVYCRRSDRHSDRFGAAKVEVACLTGGRSGGKPEAASSWLGITSAHVRITRRTIFIRTVHFSIPSFSYLVVFYSLWSPFFSRGAAGMAAGGGSYPEPSAADYGGLSVSFSRWPNFDNQTNGPWTSRILHRIRLAPGSKALPATTHLVLWPAQAHAFPRANREPGSLF
jgi:hypothetical protein